jgi:hypothetical protein
MKKSENWNEKKQHRFQLSFKSLYKGKSALCVISITIRSQLKKSFKKVILNEIQI